MDIKYMWILLQGKICRHFRWLTYNSLIGQFVHQEGGIDGVKGEDWGYRFF